MSHTADGRSAARDFSHEQAGFERGLGARQLQMIAIGGAIGTGLFLGAGGRLAFEPTQRGVPPLF